MTVRMKPGRFRSVANLPAARLAATAAGVLALAWLAIAMADADTNLAVFWFANGLLIGILLRSPRAHWPAFLAAGLLGTFAANLIVGTAFLASAGLAAANGVEVILAAWLIHRHCGLDPDLTRMDVVVKAGLWGLAIPPLVGAVLGPMVVTLTMGVPFANVVFGWYLADLMGILLVTPLVLVLRPQVFSDWYRQGRAVEGAAILASTAAITTAVFAQPHAVLLFLVPVPLMFAVLRLGLQAGVMAGVVVATVALAMGHSAHGPIAAMAAASIEQQVLHLQLFLAQLFLPLLPIGAVLAQRQRLGDEVRAARDEAERASKAKSAFLANMSHELRTPLNAVLGFSELLMLDHDGTLTRRQNDYARSIHRSGAGLLVIIKDLLDLASIENGRLSVSMARIDAASVLEDVVETLGPLARDRRMRIEVEPVPEGLTVWADSGRLVQVLLNFGSNAVKYGHEGGLVRFAAAPVRDGLVRFAVEDDGPGIDASRQGDLFEPFQRLGAERSAVEGTGIGLAIARRLGELMDGAVGADSAPGRGSTFWIDLIGAPPSAQPQPTLTLREPGHVRA